MKGYISLSLYFSVSLFHIHNIKFNELCNLKILGRTYVYSGNL